MSPASNALLAERQARLQANLPLEARLRAAFREPHPFARKPAYLKAYDVPWLSVYAKRQLRTLGVLVPLAVVVFGWPFAAKALVDASNGVYASSSAAAAHEPVKSHKIARRAMLQEGPVRLEARRPLDWNVVDEYHALGAFAIV